MKLIDAEVVLNHVNKVKEEVSNNSSNSHSAFEKGWDEGFLDGLSSIRDLVEDITIEDEIPLATPSDMIPKSEFIHLLEAIKAHSADWEECIFIDGILAAYK